jgi:hypothetical protein
MALGGRWLGPPRVSYAESLVTTTSMDSVAWRWLLRFVIRDSGYSGVTAITFLICDIFTTLYDEVRRYLTPNGSMICRLVLGQVHMEVRGAPRLQQRALEQKAGLEIGVSLMSCTYWYDNTPSGL